MRYAAILAAFAACVLGSAIATTTRAAEPIVIGETFTLQSERLDETRRINVFVPTMYGEPVDTPLPVLYMLDGGIDEDFLHIAGLLQISVSNGSIEPYLLVGIENTDRRRDMTGPTDDPEDRAMADSLGGASTFRAFIRDELIREIEARYPVTEQRAVIGESLAGLFVVETLLYQPQMFSTYIAVDPSVWWNRYALNDTAAERLADQAVRNKCLFIAAGKEATSAERFNVFISELDKPEVQVDFMYRPMPEESHATLYHPAALAAFQALFSNSGNSGLQEHGG